VVWGDRTKAVLGVAAAWWSSAGDGARLLPGWCAALVDFSKKILMVKFLEENLAKRRNCGKEVVLLVALCVKI
jgi:hypothetical protein